MDRQKRFPRSLLTTATHDHKRGEDTRARLAVLSERPDWFMEKLRQWHKKTSVLRTELHDGVAPSTGDEWILLQTLLGTWPLDYRPYETVSSSEGDQENTPHSEYTQRLHEWQEKALREAKLRSAWSAPNSHYEEACRDYLTGILENSNLLEVRYEIARAAAEIAPAGALNSLAQTLLRLTTPGVADLYQGAEFWDFSLVDPDNRRPVDFAARSAALAQPPDTQELLQNWHNGHIKQQLIARLLNARKAAADLFAYGDYRPLTTSGEYAKHCLAFLREWQGQCCLVVVPRLTANLLGEQEIPQVAAEKWSDTAIELPQHLTGDRFTSLITEQPHGVNNERMYLRDALGDFPVNAFKLELPKSEEKLP